MVLTLQTLQNISILLLASLKHIKILDILASFFALSERTWETFGSFGIFSSVELWHWCSQQKETAVLPPSLIQSLDHFLDNFSNVTFAQKTTCTILQNREWYQCCYIVLNLIWNIVHFLQQEQRLYSNIIVIIILISNISCTQGVYRKGVRNWR